MKFRDFFKFALSLLTSLEGLRDFTQTSMILPQACTPSRILLSFYRSAELIGYPARMLAGVFFFCDGNSGRRST